MREIVTVQVGSFANYIGSHFWNFQDELLGLAEDPDADPIYKNRCLDMDVFYRSGETPQGILTYTPRMVSVDLQGSLGSLRASGSLYGEIPCSDTSLVNTWTGNVSRHVSEPHEKNLFLQSLYEEEDDDLTGLPNNLDKKDDDAQNHIHKDKDRVECLENGVRFWTDYSKVHYHPQSLYEINGLWTDTWEFDNYGAGRDLASRGAYSEEINDRLRFFAEECDHIQGFQFIVDDSGGFSSVAAEFLENMADEYPLTPILLYSARGPGNFANATSQKKSISRALHDGISFSKLSSFCRLMVPLGLPSLSTSEASTFLCVDDEKNFHSSAVYAAALHSISLPFQMELLGPTGVSDSVAGALDVARVTQMLADQARQNMVAILDMAMPAPPLAGERSHRSFQGNLHSLTPNVSEDVEDLFAVESMVIHGALHSGGNRASISQVKDSVYSGYQNSAIKPAFSHLSVALSPLPIPLPFPSIFGNLVGRQGELLANPIPGIRSRGSLDINSIPMAARLRSSSAVLPFVEKRLGDLTRYGTARGSVGSELVRSWGFQKDEIEDMREGLSKMVQALDGHSRDSSDSD